MGGIGYTGGSHVDIDSTITLPISGANTLAISGANTLAISGANTLAISGQNQLSASITGDVGYTSITNWYGKSCVVASAASGLVATCVSNSANVSQLDSSSNPFQILSAWDSGITSFTPKTIVIKYDEHYSFSGSPGSATVYIQREQNLETSGAGADLSGIVYGTGTNAAYNGFIMQRGDELVIDYTEPDDIYAWVSNGSGNAALSFMMIG